MTPSPSATGFDIEIGLPAGAQDASLDVQIWTLLCARALSDVDPTLSDARAGDIAVALQASADYRELDAVAAAYLWLSRASEGVPGDQLM